MYFYLKEPNGGKSTPIILIYYINSKEKYFKYTTGKKINPTEWDTTNRGTKIRRGGAGKQNKQIQTVLNSYVDFLDEIVFEFEKKNLKLTKKYLKKEFDKKFKNKEYSEKDASEIVEEVVSHFIQAKNKSNGKSKSWNHKYRNVKNKIIFFDIYYKKNTEFKDLTEDWIDTYCGFLRTMPKLLENKDYYKKVQDRIKADRLIVRLPKNGYNDNTLNRHINFLFTYLNWAKGKYHGLDLEALSNPVKEFSPDDIHLNNSEIKLLEEVKLPRKSLIRVCELFLIGVYSGQRFSDYSVFEKADIYEKLIIKKAEKTEDNSFIPIHSKLKVLLDKYNWKLPKISLQKFNVHIKEVCRLAGITDNVKQINYIGNQKDVSYKQKCDIVSSHTARRTFITISSEKGMPDHIIMKVTGIKDVKTLAKYKKTSQQSVIASVNDIWG